MKKILVVLLMICACLSIVGCSDGMDSYLPQGGQSTSGSSSGNSSENSSGSSSENSSGSSSSGSNSHSGGQVISPIKPVGNYDVGGNYGK